MWVQQHSIKLVKYAQGYLSQPERLWTYMSPSNRCTDYGLQLTPEEWLKKPVSHPASFSWSVILEQILNTKELAKYALK